MRLLWVKAGGMMPLNIGGNIRSFQLAKALAQRHDLTLFTFYPERPEDTHQELASVFEQVITMPLEIPTGRGVGELVSYARQFLSGRPFVMSKYCDSRVTEAVGELARDGAFDVIVCDFLAPAPVIPWDAPCPKVVFTHNVEAMIWKRHFEVARNPFWKAACWREYRTTDRAERHYLSEADQVIAVSNADRDVFARYVDPSKITVVPTGVDLDYFTPSDAEQRPNRLVFTGAMDWMANEDAVIYFVEEVLPGVRDRIPDVEFYVVGRNPTDAVRRLAGAHRGVTVTGEVDDIRPFVHQSSVYVVPLRVGGGTRLKIFEAMAMGKPIVSTSIGAEGLPVRSGENIVLADGDERLAAGLVELLQDGVQRARLGANARRLVEQEYGWSAVSRHFEAALRAAAEVAPAA